MEQGGGEKKDVEAGVVDVPVCGEPQFVSRNRPPAIDLHFF